MLYYYRKKLLLALAKPLGSSDSTPWFSFTVPGSSSLLSVLILGILWPAVREWKVVVTGVGRVWGNGLIWSLLEVSTEFNGCWIITGFCTTLAWFGGMRPWGICIICTSPEEGHQTTTKWLNDWGPQGATLYLWGKNWRTKEQATLLYEQLIFTHVHIYIRKHEGITWNVKECKRHWLLMTRHLGSTSLSPVAPHAFAPSSLAGPSALTELDVMRSAAVESQLPWSPRSSLGSSSGRPPWAA